MAIRRRKGSVYSNRQLICEAMRQTPVFSTGGHHSLKDIGNHDYNDRVVTDFLLNQAQAGVTASAGPGLALTCSSTCQHI